MNAAGREEPVTGDARSVEGVVFFPNTPVIPLVDSGGRGPA